MSEIRLSKKARPLVFLWFTVFFAFNSKAFAGSNVALAFYELANWKTCDPITFGTAREILRCSSGVKKANTQQLESVVEHAVFQPIAQKEMESLNCSLRSARALRDDPVVRAKAVAALTNLSPEVGSSSAESKIQLLTETIRRENSYKNELDKIEKMLNPMQKEPIYPKNMGELFAEQDRLREEILAQQEIEQELRQSDLLLSSATIFKRIQEDVTGNLLSGGESDQKVLKDVQAHLTSDLNSDVADLKDKAKRIESGLKNGKIDTDAAFKEELWQSGGREQVMNQWQDNTKVNDALTCNLEGRYGAGAAIRDSLYDFAEGLPANFIPFLGELSDLRMAEKLASLSVTLAKASKTILKTAVIPSLLISVQNAKRACLPDSRDIVLSAATCANGTDSELGSMLTSKISHGNCAALALQAVLGGAQQAIPLASQWGRVFEETTSASLPTKPVLQFSLSPLNTLDEAGKAELLTAADKAQEIYVKPLDAERLEKLQANDKNMGLNQIARDENGRVIGYVIGQYDKKAKAVQIQSLWVDPAARGSGVAQRLMAQMAKVAVSKGRDKIQLMVNETNESAQNLYRRVGFSDITDSAPLNNPDLRRLEINSSALAGPEVPSI